MTRMFTLVVAVALAAQTLTAQGKPPAAPTEAQVRQWAAEAERQAPGGLNSFTRASAYLKNFRKLVKSAFPDYDPATVGVYDRQGRGGIGIWLVGPVAHFESASGDALRNGASVASVKWLAGPALFIEPHGVYSPDIVNVVVESDGLNISPAEGSKYMAPFTVDWYEPGEEAPSSTVVNVHGGVIVYPPSAFTAGRSVKVTIISSAGWKHVKSLEAGDLRKLR